MINGGAALYFTVLVGLVVLPFSCTSRWAQLACEEKYLWHRVVPRTNSGYDTRQMEELTKRHVVSLYLIESLFFTRWPYVASESLLSLTNLMAPVSLVGIACLLFSYVHLCTRGDHSDQMHWWQHTSSARKMAALSYWSSPYFVGLLIVGSASKCIVQGPLYSGGDSVLQVSASRIVHNIVSVIDWVFTAYVMVAALLNDAALCAFLYVIYYIFLRKYSEISYMISHLFFLVVFITLY